MASSELDLYQSRIVANVGRGLWVRDSTLTLDGVLVGDTRSTPSGAVAVTLERDQAVASDLRVEDNAGYGLWVLGGTLSTRDSVSTGARREGGDSAVHGVLVTEGARVDAARLQSFGNDGPGMAIEGSSVYCSECVLRDNGFAGLLFAASSDVTLERTELRDNRVHPNEGGGFGVYSYAVDARPASTLTMRGCTVEGHPMAGVLLRGGASALLEDNVILGGALDRETRPSGNAVVVLGDHTEARLKGNLLSAAESEAVFADQAEVILLGNLWPDNGVDLHLQNGATRPDLSSEPRLRVSEPYYNTSLACPEFWGVPTDLVATQ